MTVIKIKNSAVAGRAPQSSELNTAELALNLADRKLYSKDAGGTVFEIGVDGQVPSGGTSQRPTGASPGDLFYDTTVGALLYWDGSVWQEIGVSGETPSGGTSDRPVLPSLGEVFYDTDLNALIFWNGSSWEELSYESNASGNYVEKAPAGDAAQNISGNLTLGTDKITLDASDGSAEFGGGDISLNADGSAEFTSYLNGGAGAIDGNVIGYGLLAFSNSASTGGGGVNQNASVYARNYVGTGRNYIGINGSGATTFEVFADGSATFAERAVVGSADFGTTTTVYEGLAAFNNASNGDKNATVFASNKGGGLVWLGSPSSSITGATSAIHSNGSASFAGNITAGNVTFNTGADDPANYTTTMVDGEEQQVYNGPTLDVKEKLMEALATIEDLKTRIAALEA